MGDADPAAAGPAVAGPAPPIVGAAADTTHVQPLPLAECDRVERFHQRREWRKPLYDLPLGESLEIPSRPHVCYKLLNYGDKSLPDGAKCAREDMPFLFKAFESGQTPPHRLQKLHGNARQPTIHEYLDWTCTAADAAEVNDLDFGGFRTVVLYARYRPPYPSPGAYVVEQGSSREGMGCPAPALPMFMPKGKPISAALIRCGPDYIEVPFYATSDNYRGKGYGRCLLEAIEQIGRSLNMKRFLLCSTEDPKVRTTWQGMGFEFTEDRHMAEWDIRCGDLLYMTYTVQMHKAIPPARVHKPLLLKHGDFQQRLYFPIDGPKGTGLSRFSAAEAAAARKKRPPQKGVSKSVVKKVVKKVASHTLGAGQQIAHAALAAAAIVQRTPASRGASAGIDVQR